MLQSDLLLTSGMIPLMLTWMRKFQAYRIRKKSMPQDCAS